MFVLQYQQSRAFGASTAVPGSLWGGPARAAAFLQDTGLCAVLQRLEPATFVNASIVVPVRTGQL